MPHIMLVPYSAVTSVIVPLPKLLHSNVVQFKRNKYDARFAASRREFGLGHFMS